MNMISSTKADMTRELSKTWWSPSNRLVNAIRDYQKNNLTIHDNTIEFIESVIKNKLAVIRHRFWSIVSGADIPLNSRLSGGLILPHPNGIVIHPDAYIGPNCILFQQVTIGCGSKPGVPKLMGHVDVGAGAKILGGVTIGEHAVIGANAVVLSDVPANCIAVGAPAIIKKRDQNDIKENIVAIDEENKKLKARVLLLEDHIRATERETLNHAND